jgi:MoaA/NifB/PqqE/SkfB family radical SAM enzyme
MDNFTSLRKAVHIIDPKMADVFLPLALRHPKHLSSFLRLLKTHKSAAQLRGEIRKEHVQVPPFLILSITGHCNLTCLGCYAAASGIKNQKSLRGDQWQKVLREACDLGVFGFIIAGGEPFMFPGLLELCASYKDRLFLIFTNGTMLSEDDFRLLRKASNIVVLVSSEGGRDATDFRRGAGTYEQILRTMDMLKKAGVIFGVSATVSRNNYEYWMNESEIDHLIASGAKLGIFIEYIPAAAKSSGMMLTGQERAQFRAKILEYRQKKPWYVIHSPGDEEVFGGCVSAGRGFAHVTPSGDLTPCPVSNLAAINVAESSLRRGLSSEFFAEIRANGRALETGDVPCALFSHTEEVEEIARRTGAYNVNAFEGIALLRKES